MASFEVKCEHGVIVVRADDRKSCKDYVESRFSPQYGYDKCPPLRIRSISDAQAESLVWFGDVINWWS